MGQEENAAGEKKSAVREREEDGSSRGVLPRLGGEVEESEKGLEKKAAVLDR